MNIAKMENQGQYHMKLYNKLISLQNGDEPDPFGWITIVD